jgi:hypothetical protein
VTEITAAATPAAEVLIIMHPFRTVPDPIDSVVCGRCGHPVWDHCVGDTCAECESRNRWNACNRFKLAGFAETPPSAFEVVVMAGES